MEIDEALLKRILEGKCSDNDIGFLHRLKMNHELDEELEKFIETNWASHHTSENTNDSNDLKEILEGVHEKIVGRQDFMAEKNLSTGKNTSGGKRFDMLHIARVAAILLIFLSATVFVMVHIDKSRTAEVTQETVMLQKSADLGQKRTFFLSDGTKVILNAGSELKFPTSFRNAEDRTVELNGEGFFEVAKDISKPFRVKTGAYVTTALGTSFNITTSEDKVKIALVTGKVKVSRGEIYIKLLPGEMAECNLVDGEISKKSFDGESLLGWKEGVIKFKTKRLKEVESMLEQWYGVDIEIDPALHSGLRITGTFNNENLKSIVEGLCFTLNCHFTMDGKKVSIIKN